MGNFPRFSLQKVSRFGKLLTAQRYYNYSNWTNILVLFFEKKFSTKTITITLTIIYKLLSIN